MVYIQMTDRSPSDWEPMEELTDGELLAINGGMSARRMSVHMWHGNSPRNTVKIRFQALGLLK